MIALVEFYFEYKIKSGVFIASLGMNLQLLNPFGALKQEYDSTTSTHVLNSIVPPLYKS